MKMNAKKIFTKYEGILSHFINEGGWPLSYHDLDSVTVPDGPSLKKLNQLLKDCPFLGLNESNRLVLKSKVPVEIELQYWKHMYDLRSKEFDSLYSQLDKVLANH